MAWVAIGFAHVLVLSLAACAVAPIRWAPPADFELTIADNQVQQRFDIALTSKAKVPLCLPKEAWPASKALPAGFDGATLTTSTSTKELLPTGSAHCPGGCGNVRMEPGQAVHGTLDYAAFGDATAITNERSRKLQFEVHPFVCSD